MKLKTGPLTHTRKKMPRAATLSLTPRFSGVNACRTRVNRFSGFPFVLFCAFLALLLAFTTRAATNDLSTLLQHGLFEEEANRNLDAAISNYQSLANDFDKDRQLAATAIFRLGECYRKLGRTNEAVAQYQRIVREFSDQQTLVTLSHQNLAGLGVVENSSGATGPESRQSMEYGQLITSDVLRNLRTDLTKATADYEQERTLLDKLKSLSRDDLRRVLPTAVSDTQLSTLLTELDTAEQNLLQLKHDYSPEHPKYISAKDLVDDLNGKINDRIDGILIGMQAKLDATKAYQASLEKQIQQLESRGTPQSIAEQQPPITDEEEKEIRRIQQMIQDSPDLINAPSGDPSLTPLARAAELGQLRVARFLIEAKADVNQMSGGMTPLQHAASKGQRAMVELLLANGANVNAKDSVGTTALHSAARKGFVSVTETLLAAKADVNALDNYGASPLALAVQNDSRTEAELLLAHGADPNVVPAKSEYSNPDEANWGAPLHFAVVQKDEPMTALLLTNRAKVDLRNPWNETPLDIAAKNGSIEIAQELLDAGANPNLPAESEGEQNPLLYAVKNKYTDIVKLLLSRGANPNSTAHDLGNTTPLMAAVFNDDEATASVLLQNRADPNLKSKNESTALWDAINRRGAKLVSLLLQNGADPNEAVNASTPLMEVARTDSFASPEDRVAAAQLLIAKGANVNATDDHGNTPLHLAVFFDRAELTKLLLVHGADVNVQDKEGKTPLEIAEARQETNIVALLREHGALDNLPDFNAVRITRQGWATPMTLFQRPSNDWNQVTLFDVLGVQYELVSASPSGGRRDFRSYGYGTHPIDNSLQFPDFSRIVIHRPSPDGTSSKDIKVNAAQALDSGNCAADVPLQFGDIVEIPEADHVMGAYWMGLDTNQLFHLTDCLARHIEVIVKGNTSHLTIASNFELSHTTTYTAAPLGSGESPAFGPSIKMTTNKPLMLWPALQESKLLLASSDLSHIKVKRRDAAGKTHEWTVDCSNPSSPPNFWLRDGDVVEVPDKAE